MLTGALVNAGAIVRYLQARQPSIVTLVRMGHEARENSDEDDLCAELLRSRLLGEPMPVAGIRGRLRKASSAEKFFDPACDWAPERDFDLCTRVDEFDFVLQLDDRRVTAALTQESTCPQHLSKIVMSPVLRTIVLLTLSNVFMTFAWYAHLKELNQKPWIVAALISWGIALFEYLLQVPANRIGYTVLTLPQLKILQEVITLTVFVPFVMLYMRQPLKLDYLWAALCMMGAVYFVFRK